MADPQKKRLYKAESTLAGQGALLKSRGEVKDYIEGLRHSDWWAWPHARSIRVGVHDDRSMAFYSDDTVTLPGRRVGGSWAWNTLTVCHEVAHHVGCDEHGPWFAGAYLFIVKNAIPELHEPLLAAFEKNKIVHHPVYRLPAVEDLA